MIKIQTWLDYKNQNYSKNNFYKISFVKLVPDINLFITKPLSEPMLAFLSIKPLWTNSSEIWIKMESFLCN